MLHINYIYFIFCIFARNLIPFEILKTANITRLLRMSATYINVFICLLHNCCSEIRRLRDKAARTDDE